LTYTETLDYLYAKLPMFQRIGDKALKKDLSNTIKLLNALDNPHKKFNSIHIAGTNGKGSTTHILASILQEANYKVACYTSPHYKDFRERIKINGVFVSEDFVIDFVAKNQAIIEEIQPSFFEITVVMAFDYFAQQDIDVAIIETGMGGRFDSTNVLHPLLSIITNISLDHQQFLGDTIAKIAFEKAGIIKKDVPVLIGEFQEDTHPVYVDKAMSTNSSLFYAKELYEIENFNSTINGSNFAILDGDEIKNYITDLNSNYQQKNIQTALAALLLCQEYFKIDNLAIENGLKNVRKNTYFLGRSMLLNEKPIVIADSAHNEAGITELNNIISSTPFNQLHFVFGTVKDKDISKVLSLLPHNAQYYFCKANIPRGMDVHLLTDEATALGYKGTAFPSVKDAYKTALAKANEDDLIIISGSIFVVAEVL